MANRIRDYRICNRLSQQELGEKIGRSQNSISNWEIGERMPDIETAIELAKALDATLDDLFW